MNTDARGDDAARVAYVSNEGSVENIPYAKEIFNMTNH